MMDDKKACGKNGCNSILCNRHSEVHGYICEICLNELKEKGHAGGIHTFMKIPKHISGDDQRLLWVAFLDGEFLDEDDDDEDDDEYGYTDDLMERGGK
jgi:hypothetical protein